VGRKQKRERVLGLEERKKIKKRFWKIKGKVENGEGGGGWGGKGGKGERGKHGRRGVRRRRRNRQLRTRITRASLFRRGKLGVLTRAALGDLIGTKNRKAGERGKENGKRRKRTSDFCKRCLRSAKGESNSGGKDSVLNGRDIKREDGHYLTGKTEEGRPHLRDRGVRKKRARHCF